MHAANPLTTNDDVPGAEVFALCLLATSAVLSPTIHVVYEAALDEPMAPFVHFLVHAAPACASCAWLWSYTRRHRLSLPADVSWPVYLGWWILLPYYALRGSRRAALLPVAAFLVLCVLGQVFGWLAGAGLY